MKKYDLGFYSMGNGWSVANRLQEEHGDYKRVAHINTDRTVEYYDKELPENLKEQIEVFARTDDSNISQTQDIKIFKTRPTK